MSSMIRTFSLSWSYAVSRRRARAAPHSRRGRRHLGHHHARAAPACAARRAGRGRDWAASTLPARGRARAGRAAAALLWRRCWLKRACYAARVTIAQTVEAAARRVGVIRGDAVDERRLAFVLPYLPGYLPSGASARAQAAN